MRLVINDGPDKADRHARHDGLRAVGDDAVDGAGRRRDGLRRGGMDPLRMSTRLDRR